MKYRSPRAPENAAGLAPFLEHYSPWPRYLDQQVYTVAGGKLRSTVWSEIAAEILPEELLLAECVHAEEMQRARGVPRMQILKLRKNAAGP